MKICIGVRNLPHGDGDADEPIGTSELAQILEAKYGIFSAFLAANAKWVNEQIAEAYAGAALSAIANNDMPVAPPMVRVAEELAHRLYEEISSGNIEQLDLGPGHVPTQAALMGVNHRFKTGLNGVAPSQKEAFKKRQAKLPRKDREPLMGKRRPSFIDTGVFLNSIAAWVEDADT